MTALDRIRRYVSAVRGRSPVRILLTTNNPLGDAVGDTVMATRHVPFLTQFHAQTRIQVWTGTPDIWHILCPGVEPVAMPGGCNPAAACDIAVFECARVSPQIVASLAAAGRVVITWHAWDEQIQVRLGSTRSFTIGMRPLVNRTTRIDEAYRAIGCAPAPVGERSPPSQPARIFFNPYASAGAKTLSAPFCASILSALRRRLASAVAVTVPCPPTARTRDDAEWYGRVDRTILRLAAGWPQLERREMSSLDRYFAEIASASLVIGSDTSSQHVATAYGRASIACYPPHVGLPFYLYWGPVTSTSFHFLVPDDRRLPSQRGLASLIAEAASMLLAGVLVPSSGGARVGGSPDPWRVTCAKAAARFLRESRAYLAGERRSRRSMHSSLQVLDAALPPEWKEHLLREMVEVYQTMPAVRQRPWRGNRRTARIRLAHLNGPKTLRLLARDVPRPPSTRRPD